ncbi:serine/threonine protein kinase [bacterium]|nr:serine/threonine protein kinase [bacterium]
MNLDTTASTEDGDEFVDELKPGTELMRGQYTIEGFLAAGGFGITYLAKDSLNRRVVIKECFPGNFCRRKDALVLPRSEAQTGELQAIVRLFSQEAISLAKTNHPNIVGVHQVFEENHTAYMALDFVQGRDLLEILQEEPDSLTPDLVESYLTKVLGAVDHIHQLGILHRDISPDNILINQSGEPILIDFGAAREGRDEKVTRMLSALRAVKEGYSPQEFYIAGSNQPPSCDLYSLGATFYHIITGELPPDSQLRLSAFAAGDGDPYVSLGEKTDAYSESFVSALDQALEVLPRDRMQSAQDWIARLAGTQPLVQTPLSEPIASVVEPVAPVAVAEEQKSSSPILMRTTAMAVVAGAGFLAFSTWNSAGTSGDVPSDDLAATIEAPAVPTAQGSATVAPGLDITGLVVSDAVQQPILEPTMVEPEGGNRASDNTQPVVEDVAPSEPTPEAVADAPIDKQLDESLPFTLSSAEPGVISGVSEDAPEWLTPNVKIVSVDGQRIETSEEIFAKIEELSAQTDESSFELTLGLDGALNGVEIERKLTILKEQEPLLLNGVTFASRQVGGVWATEVVDAPASSQFETGDTLLSYVKTSENLFDQNSLETIIEREQANGTSSFSFLIRRDGEIWVEVLDLAS